MRPSWTQVLIGVGTTLGVALVSRKAYSIYQARKKLPNSTAYLNVSSQRVLVHVPENMSGNTQYVTVYFHGNGAKLEEIQAKLPAFDTGSHKSVLVIPQLGSSGDPGPVGTPMGLRNLLSSTFAETPGLEAWEPDQARVNLISHSGGYIGPVRALEHGGVQVRSVGLLDSLYANMDTFEKFAVSPVSKHFVNIYGSTTRANSLSLADHLASKLGDQAVLDTTGSLSGLTRKAATIRTQVEHGEVPVTYFASLVDAFYI